MRSNYGGYSSQQQHMSEKKKLQVVLHNYDDAISHSNGINSFAVGNTLDTVDGSTTNLFTASRDRLIKLWSVDYDTING